MGHHWKSAIFYQQADGVLRGQFGAFDVCRAVAANVLVKGLLGEFDVSCLDEGLRDMGPPDRSAVGNLLDPLPGDIQA